MTASSRHLPINLREKLATFCELWQPRTVGTFNGHDLMVDLFLVLDGTINIELRDGVVTLAAGELFVVPKGVEHRPIAAEEAHLLLIERQGTPNTGDMNTAQPRRVI